MKKIKITQVKSGIDRSERQKLFKALGLKNCMLQKKWKPHPNFRYGNESKSSG